MRSRTLRQSARAFIEIAPGTFVLSEDLTLNPRHIVRAAKLLRAELRKTLSGLAPIMGEDTLLKMCREVIAEDRPR